MAARIEMVVDGFTYINPSLYTVTLDSFYFEVVWGVVPECVGISLFSLGWVGCSCLAFVLQGDFVTTPGKALFIKSFVFVEDCFIRAAAIQSVFNVGW